MPRLDHRLQLEERLSHNERAMVTLMLQMVNPVRARMQPPMQALTQTDIVQMLRQILREQHKA